MTRLVYKLVGQKRSSDTDLGYYATASSTGGQRSPFKPMPFSRSLKRWHRVRIDGKVHRIGYSKTENTIFIDDFVDKNAKLEKPKFKRGILLVDSEKEPQLVQLLDTLDENGSNPKRDSSVKPMFTRINKEEKAADILAKEEEVSKQLFMFWDLPITKRRAIANSVGVSTLGGDSVWQNNLYQWARRNVKDFMDAYNDQDLDYIDLISRAENKNILVFQLGEWKHNGIKILSVSQQRNRYRELTKRLINDPQLENSITNEVNIKEGNRQLMVGDKLINFGKISAEDLLELAIENSVISYKHGHGYELVSTNELISGKSKQSVLDKLSWDGPTKDKVIHDLTNTSTE